MLKKTLLSLLAIGACILPASLRAEEITACKPDCGQNCIQCEYDNEGNLTNRFAGFISGQGDLIRGSDTEQMCPERIEDLKKMIVDKGMKDCSK